MTKEPHLVAIVGNDITFDSRVKKAAMTAANAGYKTTIICYSPTHTRSEVNFGNVRVIKVPIAFVARDKSKRLRLQLRPFNETELSARYEGKFVHNSGVIRRLEAKRNGLSKKPIKKYSLSVTHKLIHLKVKVIRKVFEARKWLNRAFDVLLKIGNRITRRLQHRISEALQKRVFLDYEAAFGPIIEELKPDLIHAHDYHMIGVGVTAAKNLRQSGINTKVIYDAHELIEGLSYPKRVIKKWMREERNFIGEVDDVICISEPQALRIKEVHNLKALPKVVLNCPAITTSRNMPKTIRDDIDIEGKIIVYHGQVDSRRDLETLVSSLQFISEDVHIAIVTNNRGNYVNELKETAKNLSTIKRPIEKQLHFLPYVPAADLPQYLSSADVAVIPQTETENHRIAMPNKLFESIHAKLPILVSDVGAVSTFVEAKRIGVSFKSGSPESLAKEGSVLLENAVKYRNNISQELLTQTTWDFQSKALLDVYKSALGISPTSDERGMSSISIDSFDMPEALKAYNKGLAVGPRNMAGQAFRIASAVQNHLKIPAISFAIEKSDFNFPVHFPVNSINWRDPFWQKQHREMLSAGFTHVLAESGTGVLGTMGGKFIDEQIPLLLESGISTAVLLHGSEIRDPIVHQQYEYSPFHDRDDLTIKLEKSVANLKSRLDRVDVPIFVTTPDLLQYTRGEWLPLVVDVEYWNSINPRPDKAIPAVLHMPTSSKLKGSQQIDSELMKLENAGKIRYIRPERKVPASLVPSLIDKSDIVIDGLVIGAYGVTSCQAMAAGRIVIGNTNELGKISSECPILHSDPAIISSVIHDLIDSRNAWESLGEAGYRFTNKYHNGSLTASKLSRFLDY